MSTSDLDTLISIFAKNPSLPSHYLQQILSAHSGDLSSACQYILTLPQTHISPPAHSPMRNSHTPQTRPDLQPTHIDLSNPVQAARLIESVKDIVVPALKSQLSGLSFPDFVVDTERVKYSLANLTLSSISLQPDHVRVFVTDDAEVHIVAEDIAIAVDVGRWTYRLRFPPIRDAGCAHFEFAGVKADILLRVDQRDESLTVGRCACSIAGAISFRAGNARLSWLYNTLAPILRSAFRPSLEATLTQAVKGALEQQLHDWSSWITEAT